MVFGIGDDLSVRVSANTTDFTTGISRAEDNLEEFGDQVTRTTGKLTSLSAASSGASTTFGALSVSTSGLSLSMGTLTTGLTGTAVALTTVTVVAGGLLSTLVPLAAIVGTLTLGLGALAGAFGTIIGTGILAFGEQRGEQNKERLEEVTERIERLEELEDTERGLTEVQEEQLEQLKERQDTLEEQTGIFGGLQSVLSDLGEELEPIVTEFGEEFVPLIEDAIEAIPELVRNIFAAIGGVDEFVQLLRQVGRQAFEAIPEIVAAMFELARVALPILVDALELLARNARPAFEGMLRITRELAPEFIRLGQAFIDALPQITRLGVAVLEVAVPALTSLLNVVDDILTTAQESSGFIDFIKTGIDALISWLAGPGQQTLGQVATGLVDTLQQVITAENVADVIDAAIDILGDIINGLSAWINNQGAPALSNLMRELFDGLATALRNNQEALQENVVQPLISSLASIFRAIVDALTSQEASELLNEIFRTAIATAKTLAEALISYVQSDAFVSDLEGLGGAFTSSVKKAIVGSLQEEAFDVSGPFLGATRIGAQEGLETARGFGERRQETIPGTSVSQAQIAGVETNVNIEADEEALRDFINTQVDVTLRDERRRDTRSTGTGR